MAATRRKRLNGPLGFLVRMGAATLIGVLAGIGSNLFGAWPGGIGVMLAFATNAVAMAAALAICVWWWRDIDEAAQEAHKWAWWWGGCSGMALGGAIMLTVMSRPDSDPLPVDMTAAELFVSGMFVLLTFQIVGYGIGWGVWWLRHR